MIIHSMPVSEMILKGLSVLECSGHRDHGMRTILEHDTQNNLIFFHKSETKKEKYFPKCLKTYNFVLIVHENVYHFCFDIF